MRRLLLISLLLLLNAGCSLDLPNPPWLETSLKISPLARSDYDTSIDAQLATLTKQVEKQLTGLSCKDVGVLQVVDLEGEEGMFEKYVKDEMVNRLARSAKFRVFPIDELTDDFVSSDDSIYNEIAYWFKREPVYLTGTTVELPNGMKVGIQIVSIKSGQVLATSSMVFKKDRILMGLTDDSVEGRIPNDSLGSGSSGGSASGRILKLSDNDFVELIQDIYSLYVKRINYEYNLFVDEESSVEIFLNDDYRVMNAGDMLSFSYGSHEFILSCQRITNHRALFTFASLTMTDSDDDTDDSTDDTTSFWTPDDSINSYAVVFSEQPMTILSAGVQASLIDDNLDSNWLSPLDSGFVFMLGVAPRIRRKLLPGDKDKSLS